MSPRSDGAAVSCSRRIPSTAPGHRSMPHPSRIPCRCSLGEISFTAPADPAIPIPSIERRESTPRAFSTSTLGGVSRYSAEQRDAMTSPTDDDAEVKMPGGAVRKVTLAMREQRQGHAGCVIWLTGLSGAGKTTIATELERRLFDA